jgi:hypothetical protein
MWQKTDKELQVLMNIELHSQALRSVAVSCALFLTLSASAQPGPGGPGGPGGFGGRGPGGGVRPDIELVEQFDKDANGWLNAEERKAARAHLATQPRRGPMGRGRGRGGPGGFGPQPPPEFEPGGPPPGSRPGGPPPNEMGRGASQNPAQAGRQVRPSDVKTFRNESLYDPKTLRTLFLEFENADWEKELADFYGTDVEVPTKLIVDGKKYDGIGVHFRGMSSFMMVPEGRKRSLNLAIDLLNKDQRLAGYRTLNLLNSNGDPTFLRAVLFLEIARSYIPAPKANFARVVINGESWGVYVNLQQFNTDFVKEWFGTTEGARWKVPGSPGGRGGLAYIGEDVAAYKRLYEIKSKDNAKSWAALINLCKVLHETPSEKLEAAISPILDIDGVLKFLALDKALINTDGYWTRASDYNIYLDVKGKFHLIPHDANETMRTPEGPRGFRNSGEAGGRGLDLDPFAGADDPNKALLNKLLAVPALRARYLGYVRDIAEKWLTWDRIGKLAKDYQSVIAADIPVDTRKLYPTEAFNMGVTGGGAEPANGRGPAVISLKEFVDGRRSFLLANPEVRGANLPR